jgi:hypothetical protein
VREKKRETEREREESERERERERETFLQYFILCLEIDKLLLFRH